MPDKEPTAAIRDELVATIPNLRAFAFSLCGDRDRADDLAQETLVKAWDKLDTFEEGTNLKAWLFTILRNAFYSDLRKRKREVSDVDDEHAKRIQVEPSQLHHINMIEMQDALTQLPPDQREAVLLVGAEGLSYEEAAFICQCAVGTIKSRVNRARNKLADLMQIAADDEEPGRTVIDRVEADASDATPTTPPYAGRDGS